MEFFKLKDKDEVKICSDCKKCLVYFIVRMVFYFVLISLGVAAPAFLFSCAYSFLT